MQVAGKYLAVPTKIELQDGSEQDVRFYISLDIVEKELNFGGVNMKDLFKRMKNNGRTSPTL